MGRNFCLQVIISKFAYNDGFEVIVGIKTTHMEQSMGVYIYIYIIFKNVTYDNRIVSDID